MPSTLDWLRARSDPAVVELLRARPDLTVPAPSELSVLARRLDSPPSVWRAMEGLHRFAVQVLQAVSVLSRNQPGVTRADIAELLGPGADRVSLDTELDRLETLGLVRGADPVRPSPAVTQSFGEFPAGLGPPGPLQGQALTRALAAVDPDGRHLLEKLAAGQPRGVLPADGSTAPIVAGLVDAGLLLGIDSFTVILPFEVGVAIRRPEPLGPVHVTVPAVELTRPGVKVIDGTAAGQALAAVARARRLLDLLGTTPAAALKSGGLGVRELRRLARAAEVSEPVAGLYLEVLAGAGLIAASEPRARAAVSSWTPTAAADELAEAPEAEAWAGLAATWLDLRREPGRIGSRDQADKVVTALSVEVGWIRGPADRRFVLGALADLPAGTGLDDAARTQRLAWLAPLRLTERRDGQIAAIVTEATELGVVAFGALPGAGRALLAGDRAAAAAAVSVALPEPVETVLVQADLTVVAPGRLQRELAGQLARVARVESAGSATVYRVTPDSLRQAYDAGITPGEVHQLFAGHSRTAIPQALTYLIDDVARRHGVLRVGAARAYLRSDDPAQIDAAVVAGRAAGLSIRRLAPTVAISPAALEELLETLRTAGLVPAAEDGRGGVLTLTPKSHRIRGAVPAPGHFREPAPPSPEQLTALVERMRAADRAAATETTPLAAAARLREAAEDRSSVWIAYVDSQGAASRRLIEPIAVSGGTVSAFDRLRQSMQTFALHRIVGVDPATGPDQPGERGGPVG